MHGDGAFLNILHCVTSVAVYTNNETVSAGREVLVIYLFYCTANHLYNEPLSVVMKSHSRDYIYQSSFFFVLQYGLVAFYVCLRFTVEKNLAGLLSSMLRS